MIGSARFARILSLVAFVVTVGWVQPAAAQIAHLGGTLEYTGALGPVNSRRPLCLCVYFDPDLSRLAGCFFYDAPRTNYRINTFDTRDYYILAFLDIHVNETPDPDEPFEIFRDRGARPGDAATSGLDVDDIDLIFGDENLPGGLPTATVTGAVAPSVTPTVTAQVPPSPTPTATTSPTAGPCAGDCDGSGTVSMVELIAMIEHALAGRVPPLCHLPGDIPLAVDAVVGAAARAQLGCP